MPLQSSSILSTKSSRISSKNVFSSSWMAYLLSPWICPSTDTVSTLQQIHGNGWKLMKILKLRKASELHQVSFLGYIVSKHGILSTITQFFVHILLPHPQRYQPQALGLLWQLKPSAPWKKGFLSNATLRRPDITNPSVSRLPWLPLESKPSIFSPAVWVGVSAPFSLKQSPQQSRTIPLETKNCLISNWSLSSGDISIRTFGIHKLSLLIPRQAHWSFFLCRAQFCDWKYLNKSDLWCC